MTDVITLGISGWFTPHGTLYHEEGRTLDEIAPEDWSNLLAHADAIDFFTRPDPAWPALEARIFHLTITDGERSRELAVNDPFEAPELAFLIRLTRRAMRDRLVLTPETLSEEALEAYGQACVRRGKTESAGRLMRRPVCSAGIRGCARKNHIIYGGQLTEQ